MLAEIKGISRQATEETSQVKNLHTPRGIVLTQSIGPILLLRAPGPHTPVVQCCLSERSAPTCEVSAVQTPPD